MRPNAFFLVVLLATAALPACGHNDSPTGPSQTVNLTGNWSGSLVVQGAAANMTWALSEATGSTAVTGAILVSQADGLVLLNGVLTGTFDGTSLTYSIAVGAGGIPSQPSCTGQLSGTATDTAGTTSTLNGTFAVVTSSCGSPIQNGPFTLTKS